MGRARGFTLVELVMVIMLMSIVATVSVTFIGQAARGAIDTGARQQRALAGIVISERLTRELREALPNSLRANGACIEWMPIVAASTYEGLPTAASPASFQAVALPGGGSASGRVAIYGYGRDLYNYANPGPLSPPASMAAGSPLVPVTFDSGLTHRFNTRSPNQRFYLVTEPVTLCQSGQYLYRYKNYGLQPGLGDSLPTAMPGREVVAAGLEASSVAFRVTPATLKRNAVVAFDFTLADVATGEKLSVSQEVQVRNVP